MRPLKRIAVIGGGTAGWIAAAVLINEFKDRCRIDLIESDEIGTVGVGESTIPPFLELLKSLNIDEKDFIQKTQSSFKLGIEFTDWRVKGETYFHPFGFITAGMDGYTFYQSWLRSHAKGDSFGLQDFAPSSIMARQGRFFLPQMAEKTPIGEARYALHLDAKLASAYLRDYAESRGVMRTEGKVVEVINRDAEHIDKLLLDSGQEIEADFYIDCTGFRALLIGQSLDVGYRDWSHYLPCDRAVTVQTENKDEPPPYTRAIAQDYGWMWKIPLQHRTGNGYVYASRWCSDDQAEETLLAAAEGTPLTEPRILPFKTGIREQIWKGNCLSLGLASGFIEPLESTAIHLVVRGMVHFMRHYPDMDCDQPLIDEYNRRMRQDYEEIRDFIVLHYCLTQRDDTEFWRWFRQMEWPESLEKTIAVFRIQGGLPEIMDPLFSPESWRSVCEGMGLRPRKYSQLIESLSHEDTRHQFQRYLEVTNSFIKTLPRHGEFLQSNCPASIID